MKVLLTLLALFVNSVTFVKVGYAKVTHVTFEYNKYLGTPTLLEVPNERVGEKAALSLGIAPLWKIYTDHTFHLLSTDSQVRWVGWKAEAGIRLKNIDIFVGHHSQHALDRPHPTGHFSNANTLGVRVELL